MALVGDLTARELALLVHGHASRLMDGSTSMTPPQAMRRAAELAVLCFDEMRLAQALKHSAESQKVPPLLADLVHGHVSGGGATAALSPPDDDHETD